MNERVKILEMLQQGIISVEEAEKLLRAIDENVIEVKEVQTAGKILNIDINSSDGDVVKVKLPLNLIRLLNGKNISIGNGKANDVMSQIDFDQLMAMIESGAVGELVNIKSSDGDTVVINVQ